MKKLLAIILLVFVCGCSKSIEYDYMTYVNDNPPFNSYALDEEDAKEVVAFYESFDPLKHDEANEAYELVGIGPQFVIYIGDEEYRLHFLNEYVFIDDKAYKAENTLESICDKYASRRYTSRSIDDFGDYFTFAYIDHNYTDLGVIVDDKEYGFKDGEIQRLFVEEFLNAGYTEVEAFDQEIAITVKVSYDNGDVVRLK